ncbi:quercetin 2 3-dioxygenase [Fusarium tjaetaba]|uniref:Quercetin 2 3-dioxygenase n=1 Tax=Fusarium tjaetaba TaxID=1567544 RepID=A0A8H5RVN7_9HYPO|nr:quercetin 2 3-dioxygenase [Fusarium tjaetaba]KAF5641696.1 quercetin 2 3-dioxygenase [Fusarium tjaetaba]
MERMVLPPSVAGKSAATKKPYIFESFSGDKVYVSGTPSVARFLLTGKETDGKFTILTSGGQAFPAPVPSHYHKHTHHDFLCIRGQLKVWLNDQCRILSPGDYASVAPNAVRAYQFIGDHTEIFSIITPAGFEHMFRGPMWPDADLERATEKLNSGVANVMTEFDVIPVPNHKFLEPQPWDSSDNQLPGSQKPYFLRNCTGPSALLGGTVVRPYVTGAESGNTYTLATLKGSNHFETQLLSGGIQFLDVDHCFYVSDGYLEVTVSDHDSSRIGPDEVAWLPAGTYFDIKPVSAYFKIFIYSQPGG